MAVYALSGRQVAHGETILATVRGRGLIDKAAEYGIACSGAEASLTNWANAGTSTHVAKGGVIDGRQLNDAEREETRKSLDSPYSDGTPPWGDNLDSCGLFAQRWIEGWGYVMDIMVPTYSTGSFLDHLVAVDDWQTRPAADVIADVQGYYDSSIYVDWLDTAAAFVSARPGSVTPPPSTGSGMIVRRCDGVDYCWPTDLSLVVRVPTVDFYVFMQASGFITVDHGAAETCDQNLIDFVRAHVTATGGTVYEPPQ